MTTVLVAEDSEVIRTVYALAMRAKGYTILEAENGAEAVRLAGEHRPDLIILDLMMPVLDGWGAAEALSENPVTAQIPRLAITARTLDPCSLEMLAAKFALVLRKPFRLRELFAAMDKLLTKPPAQA